MWQNVKILLNIQLAWKALENHALITRSVHCSIPFALKDKLSCRLKDLVDPGVGLPGRLVIAVCFDLAGHSSCFLTASLSFQMYGMELEAREQFLTCSFLKRFNCAFVVPQVTPTKVIWCSVYRSKHPTTFSIYSLYEPAIFGVQDVAKPPPMET